VEAALHSRGPVEEAAARGAKVATGKLKAGNAGIGRLIFDSFAPIRKTNVNFGIVLMGTPLAAAAGYDEKKLDKSLSLMIESMTPEDSVWIYKAMRKCDLGGMALKDKSLACLDVFSDSSFDFIRKEKLGPADIFKRCASNDRLAEEWADCYKISFGIAEKIKLDLESISKCFIETLAKYPDTFIARKVGIEKAKEVSQMAKWVLDGNLSVGEFDSFLRSEGNKLSPGTTADLIATGLFIKLLTP
jgi:triphosphoribosyl-dephospho-CoA synthase